MEKTGTLKRWKASVREKARCLIQHWPAVDHFLRDLRADWLDEMHALLRATGAYEDSVYFVQIGSNDGMSEDPLHRLIVRSPRWTGVLVEPLPGTFERLKRNYARCADRLRFINKAVGPSSGILPFYYIQEDDGGDAILDWASRIASFSREHVLKHKAVDPRIEDRISVMDIYCITLNQLFEEAALPRVDLLHIDAEGYDWIILKTLDLNRVRPQVVIFETINLSKQDVSAACAFFQEAGYRGFFHGLDVVWVDWKPTPHPQLQRAFVKAAAKAGRVLEPVDGKIEALR